MRFDNRFISSHQFFPLQQSSALYYSCKSSPHLCTCQPSFVSKEFVSLALAINGRVVDSLSLFLLSLTNHHKKISRYMLRSVHTKSHKILILHSTERVLWRNNIQLSVYIMNYIPSINNYVQSLKWKVIYFYTFFA